MLIVGFKGVGKTYLANKYPNKVVELRHEDYKKYGDNWLIKYIESLKNCLNTYEIVLISYVSEVILSLNTLNIDYTVCYPIETDKQRYSDNLQEYMEFRKLALSKNSLVLHPNLYLEQVLKDEYNWIQLSTQIDKKESKEVVSTLLPQDKNELTLQQLVEHDVTITEADVRDLKATTNKLKVAMLLQAKSRLNTVLKLTTTLDKLWDKLLERIDNSLDTTDTASLMVVTDNLTRALNDTNQFIMSLINNEKIQNFFIIDNSNVINISDDKVAINKREKIRKAAEIVIDNIDYFTSGQFENLKDPNVIDVSEESKDVNSTT